MVVVFGIHTSLMRGKPNVNMNLFQFNEIVMLPLDFAWYENCFVGGNKG